MVNHLHMTMQSHINAMSKLGFTCNSNYYRRSSKNSALLNFWHPIATFRQGSSDLYALYGEHARLRGWMWKLLSKYSAKREHNLFAPNFLEDYYTVSKRWFDLVQDPKFGLLSNPDFTIATIYNIVL